MRDGVQTCALPIFSGENKLVGKIQGSWGTVATVGGVLSAGVMAKKPEETESEYRERINKVKPYLRQYMKIGRASCRDRV